MKIEVPQAAIDKMMKSRVTAFNKKIRDLEAKLERRDKKIHKLNKENERLKASLMDTSEEEAQKIAQLAECLVGELRRINWVSSPDEAQECCPECGCMFEGVCDHY